MLTAEEKTQIAGWSAACGAAGPDADPFFVDIEGRGLGGSFRRQLEAGVEMAEWSWTQGPGPHTSVQLATGFRGSGKSTALRQMKANLESAGFIVIDVDAATLHPLSGPISTMEFFALLFGLVANHPEGQGMWGSWKDKIEQLLPLRVSGATAGVGASGPVASLQFVRRERPEEGNLESARAMVTELMATLTKRALKRGKRLVLVVDSLEKFTGGPFQLRDVIGSVESVLTRHADVLKFKGVHCIYTIPPVLAVQGPVPDAYGGSVAVMPSVRVVDRGGQRHQPGIDALAELLGKRVDLPTAFADTNTLERLLAASGGHVQDLLNLANRAFAIAWETGAHLPLTSTTIHRAIASVAERRMPIEAAGEALARRIGERHDINDLTEGEYEHLIGLLDNYAVLAYKNGDRWYAMHPLTRAAIEAAEARRTGE